MTIPNFNFFSPLESRPSSDDWRTSGIIDSGQVHLGLLGESRRAGHMLLDVQTSTCLFFLGRTTQHIVSSRLTRSRPFVTKGNRSERRRTKP